MNMIKWDLGIKEAYNESLTYGTAGAGRKQARMWGAGH